MVLISFLVPLASDPEVMPVSCFWPVNILQACISADGSFAEAGQHLEALKELCDTLSPEDAHRLAQTQVRECETRLAAIQRQFSGDTDAPLPDSR